jgi:glutamine synthetase
MSHFAQRCGQNSPEREQALQRARAQIEQSGLKQVRLAWCDLHGVTRCKTLMPSAALNAMQAGVGMVSTLMLKDSSERTAFKVFEPGGSPQGFGYANNLMLLPDPASLKQLPWCDATGWLQCQPWFSNGDSVALDSRRILQKALARLAKAGFQLQCGLEVEFHIYRIKNTDDQLDPNQASWPGLPPQVDLIHPGYQLLSEAWADMADAPLRIVQNTAQALGLPLLSLEIELGPSQVEAVFDVTDALSAADNMVLFRSAVKQALQRAGYHATFMCRPPFEHIMSSGWHLHQSLGSVDKGSNLMCRDSPAPGATAQMATFTLSDTASHYLAGLLAHAQAMTPFCTPTLNAYARFQPNAMAPQRAVWGRDNRGAMLRVIGECGDPATRIENRIGEPAANPYLYLASQVFAGLDGIARQLSPPLATDSPYSASTQDGLLLPGSLDLALNALNQDDVMVQAFGAPFVDYFNRIKQFELARQAQAQDPQDFERREYFSRI